MYRHCHSPKNQPSLISALMLNIKSMASQKNGGLPLPYQLEQVE